MSEPATSGFSPPSYSTLYTVMKTCKVFQIVSNVAMMAEGKSLWILIRGNIYAVKNLLKTAKDLLHYNNKTSLCLHENQERN